MEKLKRDKRELIRRYSVFLLSLFCIALGVSVITRSLVGTSPISSIPFVLSLHSVLSMGTFILILNVVLIIGQMIMLGRKGVRDDWFGLLMQLPVSIVFGCFVDLNMYLTSFLQPDPYWLTIVSIFIGCCVMALGISLEVIADVAMVSGEYFVNVASRRYKMEFGTVKIMFDVSLVVVAVGCSWILAGRVDGVREGTLLTALLTGPLVRLMMPHLAFVKKWVAQGGHSRAVVVAHEDVPAHPVITIAREYGSGGHDIGKAVAEKLGIPFYDNAMIDMVAAESGFSADRVRDLDQRLPHGLLYEMITNDYSVTPEESLSAKDAVFVAQSRVIRRLAQQGPCVIVGRCSDYVLRDFSGCVNLYIRASADYKRRRAVDYYGVAPDKADARVSGVNSARAAHYAYYTGRKWDDIRNYDAVFDSSRLTTGEITDAIVAICGR